MKTIHETLHWILDSLRHAYERPSMYGTTKRQVDGVLWTYHNIWAFIVGQGCRSPKSRNGIPWPRQYGSSMDRIIRQSPCI